MAYVDLETKKLVDGLCVMMQPLYEVIANLKPFDIDLSMFAGASPQVVEKLITQFDQFATAEDAAQVNEFKRDPYRGKPYGTIYAGFLDKSNALSRRGDAASLYESELLLERALWYFLSICDANRLSMTETIIDTLIKLGEVVEQLEDYEKAMDIFVCAQMFYMQREWMERESYCGKTSNWLVGVIIDNAARINRIARHQRNLPMTVALLKAVGLVTQGLKTVCPSTAHGAERFLSSSYPVNWRRSPRTLTSRGSKRK
jgi:hypothetical protein